MTCRRGCTRPAYSKAEEEIHKYVGTPIWKGDGPYYPADKVNAGVAMLIGKIKALEESKMTAAEARGNRETKEDEQVGHRDKFNWMVNDSYFTITAKIRRVSRYTDALVYPLNELCGRTDIITDIMKLLTEDGFSVVAISNNKLHEYAELANFPLPYTLYISWTEGLKQ